MFTCQPDGSVYNPNGGVHGGLVCTLLDSVAGLALHSTLPAGKGYTSIEIKVKFKQAALWLGSVASQVAIGALGGAGGHMLST